MSRAQSFSPAPAGDCNGLWARDTGFRRVTSSFADDVAAVQVAAIPVQRSGIRSIWPTLMKSGSGSLLAAAISVNSEPSP